jgi:transposase
MSAAEAARHYEVSKSFIEGLKRLRRSGGDIGGKVRGPGRKRKLSSYEDRLRELVTKQPDITLEELREALGIKAELSTVWYALDRLGLSYKKNTVRRRTGKV